MCYSSLRSEISYQYPLYRLIIFDSVRMSCERFLRPGITWSRTMQTLGSHWPGSVSSPTRAPPMQRSWGESERNHEGSSLYQESFLCMCVRRLFKDPEFFVIGSDGTGNKLQYIRALFSECCVFGSAWISTIEPVVPCLLFWHLIGSQNCL